MEIERKFLVKTTPPLLGVHHNIIEQCYLSSNPEVRVRKVTWGFLSTYYLTVKSEGSLVRDEFETKISEQAYNELKEKAVGVINKLRYRISLEDNLVAELDIFSDSELMLVEVEFNSESEAKMFTPPHWFGVEVTGVVEYKNKNMIKELKQ